MWDGILDALWLWYSVSVILTHNNKRQDPIFRRDMECNSDIRQTPASLECQVHSANCDVPYDVNFSIICLSDLTHISKYPTSILGQNFFSKIVLKSFLGPRASPQAQDNKNTSIKLTPEDKSDRNGKGHYGWRREMTEYVRKCAILQHYELQY